MRAAAPTKTRPLRSINFRKSIQKQLLSKTSFGLLSQRTWNFFSECITPSDCPNGGKDFVCNANKCECPSPKVLDGDKCVGKLHHDIKPTCNFRLD